MAERALKFAVLIVLLTKVVFAQTGSPDVDQKEGVQRPSRMLPYTLREKSVALEKPIDPDSYMVGPGDVFLISITGVEPYLEMIVVTPTGKLVIPEIGSVQVSSQTVSEVRGLVLDRIRETYPSYEADCVLFDIREIRVSISGAVYSPGFYQLTPVARISDLIALANDRLTNAAMHRVRLERSGEKSQTCDLTKFYYEGNLSQNPTLLGGDRVIIPFAAGEAEIASDRSLRPVLVTGEINEPGAYAYQPGLRVEDYVALAGGPTTTGSKRAVRITRVTGEGVGSKDAEIRAGDIIYVPRSFSNVFLGQLGMIQAALTLFNMYLVYQATRR